MHFDKNTIPLESNTSGNRQVNKMFFDSVESDNVNINDPNAKFYLVDVSNSNGTSAGYKFCASKNLSKLKVDPESRKKQYWLVTREQLKKADIDKLFPQNQLRGEIFKTVQEINDVFQFNPPFDPATTEITFFEQRNTQLPQLFFNRQRPAENHNVNPRRIEAHFSLGGWLRAQVEIFSLFQAESLLVFFTNPFNERRPAETDEFQLYQRRA